MRKQIIVLFFVIVLLAIPEILFAAQVGQKPAIALSFGAAFWVMLAIVYLSRKRAIGGWLLYYYFSLYGGALLAIVISIAATKYISPSEWDDKILYFLYLVSTIPFYAMIILQIIFATKLLFKKRRNLRNVNMLRYILVATIVVCLMDVFVDAEYFNENIALSVFGLIISIICCMYFYFAKRVRWVLIENRWDYDEFADPLIKDTVSEVVKNKIDKTVTIKKCPYCSENIQGDAMKCRHCGEWLKEKDKASIRLEQRLISSISALVAKQSEGIRRLVLVISVVSAVCWISYVGIENSGYGGIEPLGWVIIILGIVVAFYIPRLICVVIYWIMDGFKKDRVL
jgi:hypothetical protein